MEFYTDVLHFMYLRFKIIYHSWWDHVLETGRELSNKYTYYSLKLCVLMAQNNSIMNHNGTLKYQFINLFMVLV
jgi:hypothetical protein